jgi:PAS domain S-box-containing protein
VAFASFVLYDLQAGVSLRSIAWFIPADTLEVLIATLCLTYLFDKFPQLNSVEALAKYLCFVVILAPFAAAFISAAGIRRDYWDGWRICFFSEVLAFLTLTPAVLNWVGNGRAWIRKSRIVQLEMAALMAGLAILAYVSFTTPAGSASPALLYSLVPFLLWSAMRFGSMGISSAVLVVALLSIWGAVHGRGPFVDRGPFDNVSSIQLFLMCTAIPFMFLAALGEEHKRDEEALRKSEERLRLAVQAGRMYAFEWDAATDVIVRSAQTGQILGMDEAVSSTGQGLWASVHPDDRERLKSAVAGMSPEKPNLQISHRMVRPGGAVIWVERNTRAYFDELGRMLRIVGIVADVTARVRAEQELSELSGRLIHAQEEERTRIARELHDDLGQRMALLQINVERFGQDRAELSYKDQQELNNIAELTAACSSELHDISHQLHPSRLDTLGLVAALGGLCREFSAQHNLQVEFAHEGVSGEVPKDISLCLFRIAQEALRNVVQHSGAAKAQVELTHRSDQIDLCISDSGAGFDPAFVRGGLGLISMRERLRLVEGNLSFESSGPCGARIRARIPVSSTTGRGASDPKRRGASA